MARASRLIDREFTVAVVRCLEHASLALARHDGPVGFLGISEGTRVGLPLLAAEPRIDALPRSSAEQSAAWLDHALAAQT